MMMMDYENDQPPRHVSLDQTALAEFPVLAAQAAAAGNGGIVLSPDADNVIVLPEGVSLEDIKVVGRDLVIVAADGARY